MDASDRTRTVPDGAGFSVYDPDCPARVMLDHLTSRWGVLILATLREHIYRFSDLRRRIGGVSEKMLAHTLKTLERDGLVDRAVFPEVPPRVEYRLTERGREAAELVGALVTWVETRGPDLLDAQRRTTTSPEGRL